ncbi:MAG: MotA/TolQ/ExbB proton channel family protein [Calditrichaeota bacterium]|nr:MAG: MotA/TolQ/ExbB proton channel family protein [Calditrichota bacterium]
MSTGDLRRVIRLVQGGQPNRAARLLHQMIATFNKTGRAEPIGDDINTYLVSERDSFETFNRVMGFLSDTAGAMGLLGTVWGIFETFHAGKMDGPTILQGMSISLVTTLVGLVISLVLNMGTTTIFAFFNRQLNLLATRAEELRQALLYIEAKSSTNGRSTPPVARKPKTVAPQYQQPAASPYRQPVEAVVPVEAGTGEVIDDNGYM